MRKQSWKLSVFFMCVISLWLVSCGDDKECPTCPKHPVTLYLSVHKIDLGATGTSATFYIKNTGEETLNWTITTSVANWLTVSPTSGSNDATITVTADRNEILALGQYKAKVYVTAGTLKDTVEVFLLYGGKWLISHANIIEGCLDWSNKYTHIVNIFRLPEGMDRCFVDSVQMNFCEAGPMRLRVFNSTWTDPGDPFQGYVPDEIIIAQAGKLQGLVGENTIPVSWYVTTERDFPFFVGYYLGTPPTGGLRINYDEVVIDTVSYAFDFTTGQWGYFRDAVFFIRLYISPVLEYAPKISPEQTPLDLTPREREILSQRKEGVLTRSVKR